jgi:release factor glutamine methyltransferase
MARRFNDGEPIQYIFGHWSFRSLELKCDTRALIPRPETEQLVDLVLDSLKALQGRRVLEIGTGTGAIAISLAVEVPGLDIVATDISTEALALATENLDRFATQSTVKFVLSDLFESLDKELKFDLIVSNPPYVPSSSEIPPVVRDYEPHVALFGGPQGLNIILPIICQAQNWLSGSGARVLLEIDESHGSAVVEAAEVAGYSGFEIFQDLAGKDRFARLTY